MPKQRYLRRKSVRRTVDEIKKRRCVTERPSGSSPGNQEIREVLLFPGLPLIEYAKQKGYVDKDLDLEKHVAEATEINIKTPFDRELRNVAALFWLMVKFPRSWISFFRRVVALPDNVCSA